MISVSYKQNLIRVFFVYSPYDFLELKAPDVDWVIFVSKLGFNIFSDQSGVLALGGITSLRLNVYNIFSK